MARPGGRPCKKNADTKARFSSHAGLRRLYAKLRLCLPVQDDQAIAEPVRGVHAPRHVCADTQAPVERTADTNPDALAPRTAGVAGKDRLGRMGHGID